MFVYKPLTDEALSGSAVKECEEFSRFQSSVERNWDLHSIQSW